MKKARTRTTRLVLSGLRTIVALAGIFLSVVSLYFAINWRKWAWYDAYESAFFLFGISLFIGISGLIMSVYGLSPILWHAIFAEYGSREDELEHETQLRKLVKWFVW